MMKNKDNIFLIITKILQMLKMLNEMFKICLKQ